jgi:hypothetical protein
MRLQESIEKTEMSYESKVCEKKQLCISMFCIEADEQF